MSTLYIDRQGTQLRTDSGVLHIETPDGVGNRRLPIKFIDRVVLRADTQLSSRVLCALAESGSSLLALGGRGGQQIAQLTGAPHGDARRRWQQVLTLSQPDACAALAKSIVSAKVRRQHATLAYIAQQRPDLRKPMHDGQATLDRIINKLRDTAHQPDLATLRGLEGAAAAAYFSAYFSAFAPALGANNRNRRPPKDPVNAVLSLSYTMLYSQASSACWAAGLDPALGALHTLSHNRAALACDLMEPHRPRIDLWVWQLFRGETLRPEHFGHDGAGACLLGKAGRSHYYQAWEAIAHRQTRSLLGQARQLARAFDAQTQPDTWAHLAADPFPAE
ncbi:MAG: CRISPR-associated endonuclease Cas1 [Hydrogenophaga sp.]